MSDRPTICFDRYTQYYRILCGGTNRPCARARDVVATAYRRATPRDMFWDSPTTAVKSHARRGGGGVAKTTKTTTAAAAANRVSEWLRTALEHSSSLTTTVTATHANVSGDAKDAKNASLLLDDAVASPPPRTAKDEIAHLKRHVDALTTLAAESETRAKAGALAAEKLAIVREELESVKKDNASLCRRADEIDALYAKAKVSAAASEARANAARDAMVSAKCKHEEALKRAYGERDACRDRCIVESERLHSNIVELKTKIGVLEQENRQLEADVRAYGEETAHLDEIIALNEAQLASMAEEKYRIEKRLNEMTAQNVKAMITSPFGDASSPTPVVGGTPRLAKMMCWIEDSFDAIASPVRAPFADISNKENSHGSLTKRSLVTPGAKGKTRMYTPKSKPPTPTVEAQAPIEEDVAPAPPKKTWRFTFANKPEHVFMGRCTNEFGAVRVRLVASVTCALLAAT